MDLTDFDLTPDLVTIDDINVLIMAVVLSMSRIFAFLAASPILNRSNLPRMIRVGLTFGMSFMTVPSTFDALQQNPLVINFFVPLLLKELVLGFLLGILVWMPIRGLELTGVLLDTQIGSANAQEMDPLFGAQTTLTAGFLLQVFGAFFFASGGFLMIQLLLFQSTQIWPPAEPLPPLADTAIVLFIQFTGQLFLVGVLYAAPISGMLLLADVIIAFVARSAPTLNALVFGMPVKTTITCMMLVIYVDTAFPAISGYFAQSLEMLKRLFENE